MDEEIKRKLVISKFLPSLAAVGFALVLSGFFPSRYGAVPPDKNIFWIVLSCVVGGTVLLSSLGIMARVRCLTKRKAGLLVSLGLIGEIIFMISLGGIFASLLDPYYIASITAWSTGIFTIVFSFYFALKLEKEAKMLLGKK